MNLLLIFMITLISSTYAQSCSPSKCSATCTPGCTSDEVCTLGTMVACGVCPSSKCLLKSSINNIHSSNNNSSSSNAGLIGGMAGGLLGGGLVLGTLGYLYIRRRNKKRENLPTVFYRNHVVSDNNMKIQDESVDNNRQSRNIVSGVIPVAFVPPSNRTSVRTSYYSEAETPRAHISSFSTFDQSIHDNPFNGRPISTADSLMTTNRRDSTESIVLAQCTATVQAIRAKPQVMRVNTVRFDEGIKRSGSFKKTILPDNPFDDKHIARHSLTENTISTERKSTAADGEITIFFQ